MRDAFRRYMAQEPDAWDYTLSDIPSPLTDEMEAAQLSKKVRRAGVASVADAQLDEVFVRAWLSSFSCLSECPT